MLRPFAGTTIPRQFDESASGTHGPAVAGMTDLDLGDHGVPVIALNDDDRAALSSAAEALAAHDPVAAPDDYVAEAQIQAARLSASTRRALLAFRRFGSQSGALLIRRMPTGAVPPTPTTRDHAVGVHLPASAAMSVLVATLGEQFGFRPERNGEIVQDVVPVAGDEQTQNSTSSDVVLRDHVEMAFSEYRPDFVVLACLRPDHVGMAGTTLSSGSRALELLPRDVVQVLRQERFATAVDESFMRSESYDEPVWIGPIAVVDGDDDRPRLRADFAETRAVEGDRIAEAALLAFSQAAAKVAVALPLDAGDMLVVDNHRAFHGRTPFRARGDGRDRWLIRTWLARDLARSERVRPYDRRVIDTDYRAGSNVLNPIG